MCAELNAGATRLPLSRTPSFLSARGASAAAGYSLVATQIAATINAGGTRCVLYVARECQTSRGHNPCSRKGIPGTRSVSTATSQRQGQRLPSRSPAACRRDSLVERSPLISTSSRCKAQGSLLHREYSHNFHARTGKASRSLAHSKWTGTESRPNPSRCQGDVIYLTSPYQPRCFVTAWARPV